MFGIQLHHRPIIKGPTWPTRPHINRMMISLKSILASLALASSSFAEEKMSPFEAAEEGIKNAFPYIHIENTQPPANMYVTHCTAMIDGNLAGCEDASSEPFKLSCDDKSHTGVQTRSICETATITIDWESKEIKFQNDVGDIGSCTLDKDEAGGGCYVTNLGDEKGPNCKAVGSRFQYAVGLPESGISEAHSASLTIYKDGKEVGAIAPADDINTIGGEWVDVTSELPYVFEWKADFHFNYDYCYGKYADQTDLEGTPHHDVDAIVFGTHVNNYCEIPFYC